MGFAYTSDESGANEVYVQSFPVGGAKRRVSSKGGDWVRWRRDGREMFYVSADRQVMSVGVHPNSNALDFGSPHALFKIPVALATLAELAPYTYDVMPNGQRFLAVVPAGDGESQSLTVTLNWQAELATDKTLHK